MEDYPKTLAELERCFSNDEDCRKYLATLRCRKAFRVLNAGMIKPGIWPMVICCAESAVISSPSRREQSFKIHMFRWLHGSERCGISAFRKMEQAHWGYSEILVWGAIEQHG